MPRGDVYDARFTALERSGQDVHGEAHFVAALGVSSVLDAGVVQAEWRSSWHTVVSTSWGSISIATMLAVARRKAPHLAWYEGDLATLELARPEMPGHRYLFDAIVLAGNVMIFLAPGSEVTVVANLARYLAPGGRWWRGFSSFPGGLTLAHYDAYAAQAGLALAERWATWDRHPWSPESDYAVSVHRCST